MRACCVCESRVRASVRVVGRASPRALHRARQRCQVQSKASPPHLPTQALCPRPGWLHHNTNLVGDLDSVLGLHVPDGPNAGPTTTALELAWWRGLSARVAAVAGAGVYCGQRQHSKPLAYQERRNTLHGQRLCDSASPVSASGWAMLPSLYPVRVRSTFGRWGWC